MRLMVAFDIVSICAISCCGFDKKVPHNYLFLFLFTFANGWLASITCLRMNPMVVLEAALLTLAVVIGITIYAMTTSSDFTYCGAFLWIASMIFSMGSMLLYAFGIHNSFFQAVVGVILFSCYLVWDTQMIMGGDEKRAQFDEDSYILAAVSLYLDIINLFLNLLQILNDES